MKIIFVVLSAVFAVVYPIVSHCVGEEIGVVIKALASMGFVAAALAAYLPIKDKSPRFKKYGTLIIVGLFVSLMADVLLDVVFLAGFAVFFAAQIIYLIAFFSFGKPTKRTITLLLALYIPLMVFELLAHFQFKILDFEEMLIPILLYLLAIVMMTVKSFDGWKLGSTCAKAAAIGGLLFLLSDFELQFGVFTALEGFPRFLISLGNAVLYYAAQLVIACSLSEDIFKKSK